LTSTTADRIGGADLRASFESLQRKIMDFYDAHAHCIKAQRGGFLIGLEGNPRFEGAMSNQDARAAEDPERLLFAVEYVTSAAANLSSRLLKFHPRREGYSPTVVKERIGAWSPSLCIIDTLNQPTGSPETTGTSPARSPSSRSCSVTRAATTSSTF
jgi:hypothetical protein